MSTRNAIILLVDDDELMLMLTQRIYKRAKLINEFFSVADGVEALDFLYKRNGYEHAPTPDLIFMDLQMPRMSGVKVLEIMQKDSRLSDIPVVMVTSSRDSVNMDLAEEHGAIGYIEKPINVETLMDTCLLGKKLKFQLVVDED